MTLSIPLDSVLRTEELKRRPSRAPGYQVENQALLALAQELTTSPGSVLQALVDLALVLCRGDSLAASSRSTRSMKSMIPAPSLVWLRM